MKRRTLIVCLIALVAIILVGLVPAQASLAKDILWGKSRVYVYPGGILRVTGYLPPEVAGNPVLAIRYKQADAPVYAGTRLRFDWISSDNTALGRRMGLLVSDPSAVVPWQRGMRTEKYEFGGLRLVDEYYGKYGSTSIDTTGMEPGPIFAYLAVWQKGKYHRYGEIIADLEIAPPLQEVIPAMKDADDETLKQWGLVATKTLEEVVGQRDQMPATFDLHLAGGGVLRGVRVKGRPEAGRTLGICNKTSLIQVCPVTQVEGNQIYTSTNSAFMTGQDVHALRVAWVVKVRVHHLKGARQLTAQQERNLTTFPSELQPAMREMATSEPPVKHLLEPYRKGQARQLWADYQLYTMGLATWTKAPYDEYVPETRMKEVRVITLAPSGLPIVQVKEASRETVTQPGIFRIVWQLNPIRNNNRQDQAQGQGQSQGQEQNQQQQQEQQQEQDQTAAVSIDP